MEKAVVGFVIVFILISVFSVIAGSEFVLEGDINNDSRVNVLDLEKINSAFGSTPEDENWNSEADVMNDDEIDVLDLAVVGSNFDLDGKIIFACTRLANSLIEGEGNLAEIKFKAKEIGSSDLVLNNVEITDLDLDIEKFEINFENGQVVVLQEY